MWFTWFSVEWVRRFPGQVSIHLHDFHTGLDILGINERHSTGKGCERFFLHSIRKQRNWFGHGLSPKYLTRPIPFVFDLRHTEQSQQDGSLVGAGRTYE